MCNDHSNRGLFPVFYLNSQVPRITYSAENFCDTIPYTSERRQILNKRSLIFIILLPVILSIASHASAYDSYWDLFPGFTEKSLENKELRSEYSLTINTLQLSQNKQQQAEMILKFLNGLQLDFASQGGKTPMASAALSRSGIELFTYDVQLTNPYYVSSNLLEEKTYRIYPEDLFEEKVTKSIYKLIDTENEQAVGIPKEESIEVLIKAVREARNASDLFVNTQTPLNDQNFDTSAFEAFLPDFMSRFEETDPVFNVSYRYTDFPQWKRQLSWPAQTDLPAPINPVKAISAVFLSDDIIRYLDLLRDFFINNPGYANLLNQHIRAGLLRSNPNLAAQDDVDYLSMLITGVQELIETEFSSGYLYIVVNQDDEGQPLVTTVEIGKYTETDESGMFFSVQQFSDEISSIMEFAADSYKADQHQPIFRLLTTKSISSSDTESQSVNFRYDNLINIQCEYEQKTDHYNSAQMVPVSDTDFRFIYNKDRGSGKLYSTGSTDPDKNGVKTTQFSYEHISNEKPVFSIDLTGTAKTVEPLPVLSDAESIPAAQLNTEDYDGLVSQIFFRILMLVMNL